MVDWPTIIVTAGVGGSLTAGGALIKLAIDVARIGTKLDEHIVHEEQDRLRIEHKIEEQVKKMCSQLEKKMPNGELEEILEIVRTIEQNMPQKD